MDANGMPTRRDVLAAAVGTAVNLGAGCNRSGAGRLPPHGTLVGPNQAWGHRLRDQAPPLPSAGAWHQRRIVIVGGGIAGLSAAYHLRQAGQTDFVLLELEPRGGGTSASGRGPITNYPWGAHYLPVPQATNLPLVELLRAMRVVVGADASGEPIVAEEFLCRVPQERLYRDGAWRADLDPLLDAPAAERAQAEAYAAEVDRWVAWRDDQGRRAFTLPTSACSTDPQVLRLDHLTMTQWLDEHGWDSPRLRWLIDYGCRDDYGLTIDQTSAWAGLFYAASRKRAPGHAGQPLITWPEGNGRVVDFLMAAVKPHVQLDTLVWHITPALEPNGEAGYCQIVTQNTQTGRVEGWRAERVIFAAPQFVARRIIAGYGDERGPDLDQFQYGSWLVANLHLRDRPTEPDIPLAWDNVLYDSRSLGYVVATHQAGSDYGPSVWTYYLPWCGPDPVQERRRLDELDWSTAAELVLSDLEQAHPDLRSRVTQLDVMRWGHAMIRPVPGFISGAARKRAATPWRGVHFAQTDLSGVALLEEAFDHGRRAAREVLPEQPDPTS